MAYSRRAKFYNEPKIWVYYAGREFEGRYHLSTEESWKLDTVWISWCYSKGTSASSYHSSFYLDTHWAVDQKRWSNAFFLWERTLPEPRFYTGQKLEVFFSKAKPPREGKLLEIEKETGKLKVSVDNEIVRVRTWCVSLPAPTDSVTIPCPDILPD
ncbi:MAG: hypothetical protein F6K31_07825 [Symploca sp. SIO2G7]|nr:hypothetical protein [Symploca sp. SIO2G7]